MCFARDLIFNAKCFDLMTVQMRGIMSKSKLGAATPYPVPGLAAERVLVMTRLFGYKVKCDAVSLCYVAYSSSVALQFKGLCCICLCLFFVYL